MATKQLSIVLQAVDQLSGPTTRATNAAAVGVLKFAAAGDKAAAANLKLEIGLGKVVGLLGGLAAAAGGVVALNRIVSAVKGTADELDRLGKLSRKLDIPVEDLSALKYAADATGAGFENLASGIETARKNIVQFVRFGDGKAADVLKSLRTPLTGTDGTLRPIASLLPDLLDEIKEFSQGDQALIVRKLFGDESALLFIQQGARGLRELTAEAQKFGGIFTKADTDAAERLNDSIQRIQTSLKALKAQLLVEVEPALVQAFDSAAASLARGRPFIRGAGQLVKDLFSADEQTQQEAGERLARIIDNLGDAVGAAATAGGRLAGEGFIDGLVFVISAAGPRILDGITDAYVDVLTAVKSSTALTAAFGAIAGPTAGLQLTSPLVKSLRGQFKDAVLELDRQKPLLEAKIAELTKDVALRQKGVSFLGELPDDALKRAQEDLAGLEAKVTSLGEAVRKQTADTGTQSRAALALLAENAKINGRAVVEALRPVLNIGEDLRGSAGGRGAFFDAMDKVDKYFNPAVGGGGAATGVRQLTEATSEMVGPPKDAAEAYQKLLDVIRALDLEAREAEALGRDREAGRIRLVNSIEVERQKLLELGEAAQGVREQFERVSLARLKSYDLETDAIRIVEDLTRADEEYRRGLAERAQLVETGSLKEFQATRVNIDAARALRDAAEASLARLDELIARSPEFAAKLDDARKKILSVLSSASGKSKKTYSPDFGGGLDAGFDLLIQRAEDFEAQGKQTAETVGSAMTSNLGEAIFAAGEDFKNLGSIAQNFASQTVRSIGQVAAQMLALRIIGGVFGAFGAGANAGGFVVGGMTGVARFASGGIVPGPSVNRDIVPALLTPGEAVLRRDAVRSIGLENVAKLNRVGGAALGGGGPVISMTVNINGAQNPAAIRAELDRIPRQIVEALRQSPAYRGDMRSALDGA